MTNQKSKGMAIKEKWQVIKYAFYGLILVACIVGLSVSIALMILGGK